jgi:hypothetical protein
MPGCCVNGCEPERRIGRVAGLGHRRLRRPGGAAAVDGGGARRPSSAWAIAAMCSGVLPQQPPAMSISMAVSAA